MYYTCLYTCILYILYTNGIYAIHATYLYNVYVYLSIYAYAKSIYALFYQVLANSIIYCLGEEPFGGNDDGDRIITIAVYYNIIILLYEYYILLISRYNTRGVCGRPPR